MSVALTARLSYMVGSEKSPVFRNPDENDMFSRCTGVANGNTVYQAVYRWRKRNGLWLEAASRGHCRQGDQGLGARSQMQ